MSHLKFYKSIPLPSYDMVYGSNRRMVRWLEVLQCSKRHITRRRYYSTCKRRVPQQLGFVLFKKKIITFFMNSDVDKLYMKIIVFDEIYNFVVQTF
jgi:hypothetical protein